MKALTLAALSFIAMANALPSAANAAENPVPCEKMLGDLNAALKATKASDADKAKASDLKTQGLERCKADDDAGADALFAQALKALGK